MDENTNAPIEEKSVQPAGPSAEQQPGSAQDTAKQTGVSGMAVAGLVLGILAILGSFVPLLNILTLPFALVGLALAIAGLVGINKGKHTGKGMALAGIVLSALALIVTFGMYGFAGAAADSPRSESTSAASQSQTDVSSQDAAELSSSPESESTEPADAADSPEQAAGSESSDGVIDADKFAAIKQGMSYDEVVGIIGSEGELVSSSSVAGIETASYSWESDGWGMATIMFQDGEVINKTQVGVGGASTEVTKAAFEKVENGMSYEQVVEVLGGEGELMSETEVAGITMAIYTWDGNSLFSSCQVTFQNGEVTSKSQYGLE